MGHSVSGVGLSNHGGHEGNRRYCHSTADNLRIYRWDVSKVKNWKKNCFFFKN